MNSEQIIFNIKRIMGKLSTIEGVEAVSAKLIVPSETALEQASKELSCHLYDPFEGFHNDSKFFTYSKGRVSITVEGSKKYRKATQLVEVS